MTPRRRSPSRAALARLGERHARARVEVVCAAVDGLSSEELSWTVLPQRDYQDRLTRLGVLEDKADRVGRGPLLTESRALLQNALDRRRGRPPEAGTWGASVDGQTRLTTIWIALEDVASVAVMQDLIDPADAAALAAPGRALLGLQPLPGTPSAPEAPTGSWEPTVAEWEAAWEDGPEVVEIELNDEPGDAIGGRGPGRAAVRKRGRLGRGRPDTSAARKRGRAATLIAGVVAVVAVVALLVGLASGDAALALLAVAGLGVLGWIAYDGLRRP